MAENRLALSLRIASADWYMCEPVPGLDACRSDCRMSDVPVIRIFGTTPSGRTTCLHVHGAFPHLTIPYRGPDVMGSRRLEIERYLRLNLTESLDTVLSSTGENADSKQKRRVLKISLLRGKQLSCFCEEQELFLRIYFHFPGDLKRAAEFVQNGFVLDRRLQLRQNVVSYISQFLLDHNLQESSFVHANNCQIRMPVGKPNPIGWSHMSGTTGRDASKERRERSGHWSGNSSGPPSSSHYGTAFEDEELHAHPPGRIKPEDAVAETASQIWSHPLRSEPALPGKGWSHSAFDLEADVFAQDISDGDDFEVPFGAQHDEAQQDGGDEHDDSESLTLSRHLIRKQIPFYRCWRAAGLLFSGSASPAADGDTVGGFMPSRLWNAVVQGSTNAEIQNFGDDVDDVIPQLDGTSDDLRTEEDTPTTSKDLDANPSPVTATKSKIQDHGTVTKSNVAEDAIQAKACVMLCVADEITNKKNTPATTSVLTSSVAFPGAVTCLPSANATVSVRSSTASYSLQYACETAPTLDVTVSTASAYAVASPTSNAPESVTKTTAAETGNTVISASTAAVPSDAEPAASSVSGALTALGMREDETGATQKCTASITRSAFPENDTTEILKTADACKKESSNAKKCASQRSKRRKNNIPRKPKKRSSVKPTDTHDALFHEKEAADSSDPKSKLSEAERADDKGRKSTSAKRNLGVKIQGSKVAKRKKDTILQRVEARTNVFTTILNENPGVMLYDKSTENMQRYTHSAIVNFNSPAKSVAGEISGLDGTVIKITSTPVSEKCSKDGCARAHGEINKTAVTPPKDAEKPTRSRRQRPVSKNSYLEDPLYETVFDSDWDSEDSDVLNVPTATSTPRPKRSKTKKRKEAKRKKNRKPRVVTKWIIVNRFKGMSNMKIGLWKISTTKQVKLTPELLRLYELYSPSSENVRHPPIRPPVIPPVVKPRPMGRRSKHMLAILCPFGPRLEEEGSSVSLFQPTTPTNTVKNLKGAPPKKVTKDPDSPTHKSSTLPTQTCLVLDMVKSQAEPVFVTVDAALNSQSLSTQSSPPCSHRVGESLPDPVDGISSVVCKHSTSVEEPAAGDVPNAAKQSSPSCSYGVGASTPAPVDDISSVACNRPTPVEGPVTGDAPDAGVPLVVSFKENEAKNKKNDDRLVSAESILSEANNDLSPPKQEGSENSSGDVENLPTNSIRQEIDQMISLSQKDATDFKSTENDSAEQLAVVPSLVQEEPHTTLTSSEIKCQEDKSENHGAVAGTAEPEKPTHAVCEPLHQKEKTGEFEKGPKICTGKASKLQEDIVSKNLQEVWMDHESTVENDAVKVIPPKKKSGSKSPKVDRTVSEKNRSKTVGSDIMKTHPVLTSIFGRSKTLTRKSEGRKKSIKLKREAKRKRPPAKSERNSPSPHDSDREPHVTRSIVPVSSRTVEPLCNRVLPCETNFSEKETDTSTAEETLADAMEESKSFEKPVTPNKTSLTTVVEKSPVIAEKKSSVTIIPSTKRVYSPSRKVTRNSVAVKLNSISPPGCMFTVSTDDSTTPFPPPNALLEIVFPSPPAELLKSPPVEPPRPWSPMLTHAQRQDRDETEAKELLEEFAESFGAASKILGFVDESVFSNMDCIGELLDDHQSMETQKEQCDTTDSPPSSLKEESEMLKHFDKIFKDVSSNGASTSRGRHDKQSSIHLDEFEEETLLEFIDEMTSPTQPADPISQQPRHTTFPTLTPLASQDDSNSNPFPQMISPAIQDAAETTDIPVFPNLPQCQEAIQPQRPTSAMPQLNCPSFDRNPEFCNPIAQQSRAQGRFMHADQRPQSCHPGSTIPDPPHIQRPASAMGQWPNGAAQSHNYPYNGDHAGGVRKDLSSPIMFSCKNQAETFHQGSQVTQDCTYSRGRGSMPRPQSCQVPLPYTPQMPGQYSYVKNQGYSDASQLPRPSSAVEPPLQVFHTHVHHHHHVHSINNTPTLQKGSETQRLQVYPQVSKVKSEIPLNQVKVENVPNMPWPAASKATMAASEHSRASKPPEKPKTKKPQFYVPNSPFPFPSSSPLTTTCIDPQGLVQNLTYVPTTTSQGLISDKSNFCAYAGVPPIPQQGPNACSPAFSQFIPMENSSAILKGVCHGSSTNLGAKLPTARNVTKARRKPVPRSKQKSSKTAWNPDLPLPTIATTSRDAPSAKTPYGLMKQNSLSAVKKKLEPSRVTERKRKTVSDFRAPPGTPTISLTGGASAEKGTAQAFELSQDMQECSTKIRESVSSSADAENAFSAYNFASVSENLQGEVERTALKLTVNKALLAKASKAAKPRQKRSSSSGSTQRPNDTNYRPVPKQGEELILNFVTGEWEIVPADSAEKNIPVVFSPEEQALSQLQTSPSACAMVQQRSSDILKRTLSPGRNPMHGSTASARKHDTFFLNEKTHDLTSARKKKVPKLRIGAAKQSSTPEYVVSAVDLESSSPRLKLTLKKTPPVRGKPQLSTLVSASNVESIVPSCFAPGRTARKDQTVVDEPETSDSDDCALNVLKKRKRQKLVISEGSDSDFHMDDVSDGSTDDASDNLDGDNTERHRLPNMDFNAHLHAVRNMYVLKPRPGPSSMVVVLEKDQAAAALATLGLPSPKRTSAIKDGKCKLVKSTTFDRSKDEKLMLLAGMEPTDVKTFHEGPSPAKILRTVPDVKSHYGGQAQSFGEAKSDEKRSPTTSSQQTVLHEANFPVIKTLLEECCDRVASTVGPHPMSGNSE